MFKLVERIESVPMIGPLIKKWYWKYIIWKTNPRPLIMGAVAGKDAVSVMVIGANDGVSTDPVFPLLKANPRWRGTFVEPVPYLFEKLKQNYGSEERFTFVNAAVSDEAKPLQFFYVSADIRREHPDYPGWVEQLGTFDKRIILESFEGRLAPYLVETEVAGIKLEQLLKETDNAALDVLVIDTEGADWKILRQLDLDRHAPTVILFENCFLTSEERVAAMQFLRSRYKIRDLGKDYFCQLKRRSAI